MARVGVLGANNVVRRQNLLVEAILRFVSENENHVRPN